MKLPAISISRWAINAEGNLYREDGYVGIGTDSPTVALDVVGDVKVSGNIINDSINTSLDGYQTSLTALARIDSQQTTWNTTVLKDLDGYATTASVNNSLSQQTTWNTTVLKDLDGYETITAHNVDVAHQDTLNSQQSQWNTTVRAGLDGYVPYTGATRNVDLGQFSLTAVNPGGVDAVANYVAAGAHNEIAVSVDGINWTIIDVSAWFSANGINTIVYADGKWVVTGASAVVIYSTDGFNWTLTDSLITAFGGQTASYVAYGNGKWAALYRRGTLATSVDAINWAIPEGNFNTIFSSPSELCLVYGDGKFVVIGRNSGASTIAYSTDAITWTQIIVNNGPFSEGSYTDRLIFAVDNWVASTPNDGTLWSSGDLEFWTQVISTDFILTTVTNGTDLSIAIGTKLWVSAEGASWGQVSDTTVETYGAYSLAYANGKFIAVTNGDVTYTSSDGYVWSGNNVMPFSDTQYCTSVGASGVGQAATLLTNAAIVATGTSPAYGVEANTIHVTGDLTVDGSIICSTLDSLIDSNFIELITQAQDLRNAADGYVPYTGATRNVDLGNNSLTASAGVIGIGLSGAGVYGEGVPGSTSTAYYDSGDVVGSESIGTSIFTVSHDGTNAWVTKTVSPGNVLVLDSGLNTVAEYSLGTNQHAAVSDGTNMWFLSAANKTLKKILASTGELLGTFTYGTDLSYNMLFANESPGPYIYLAITGSDQLVRLWASDPGVGPYESYTIGSTPRNMAFDGTYIWVMFDNGTVKKWVENPERSEVYTYNVCESPSDILWDGANIWVTTWNTNEVSKYTTEGVLVDTYSTGDVLEPAYMVFDGTNIWIADDYTESKVVKINPSDGSIIGTYDTSPSDPALSICVGANRLWISDGANVTTLALESGVIQSGTTVISVDGVGVKAQGTGYGEGLDAYGGADGGYGLKAFGVGTSPGVYGEGGTTNGDGVVGVGIGSGYGLVGNSAHVTGNLTVDGSIINNTLTNSLLAQTTWNATVLKDLDGYETITAHNVDVAHQDTLNSQQSQWNTTVRAGLDGYATTVSVNNSLSQQTTWNATVLKDLDGYETITAHNVDVAHQDVLNSQQAQWNTTVRAGLDGYETTTAHNIDVAHQDVLNSQQAQWNTTVRAGLDGYALATDVAHQDTLNSQQAQWNTTVRAGLDGYVPYTGATANLDLGTRALISSTDAVSLGTDASTSHGLISGDVIVGGKFEVDGYAYFDGYVAVAGNITSSGQIAPNGNALLTPNGTTQLIDFSNGNFQTLSLVSASGNVTVTMTSMLVGASYCLKIIQHASAAKNVVWGSPVVKWAAAATPTITVTVNAIDIVSFIWDGTNMYGSIIQDLR